MIASHTADQDLCVSCGICCGGALFDNAKVTPEETPRLRELGFVIEADGDQPVFALPCGNLCATTGCKVYQSRATICRTYRCATLRAFDSGEIDRPEADRRVEAAKAAIAAVRKRLLPGETFRQMRARFGDDRSPAPGFKLAMVAYDMTLDRYFRRPHQRVFNPS